MSKRPVNPIAGKFLINVPFLQGKIPSEEDPPIPEDALGSLIDIMSNMRTPQESPVNEQLLSILYFVDMGNTTSSRKDIFSSSIDALIFGIKQQLKQLKSGLTILGLKNTKKGWKGSSPKIRMKDHKLGESLVCPKCGAIYNDPTDIIFAQGPSLHLVISQSHQASSGLDTDIHMVMVPICTECYCNNYMSYHADFSQVSVASIFVNPDPKRHIVPLIPECYYQRISTPANAIPNTGILYWPKDQNAILCREIKKDFDATVPPKGGNLLATEKI